MKRTIIEMAKAYVEDLHKGNVRIGIIPSEWVEKVSNSLNLKDLSDEELSNMWMNVCETLSDMIDTMRENEIKEAYDYIDAKSAFLEVVNAEARSRRGL